MGGACGTYGGRERWIQRFDGGELMERDHFKELGIDGRIILKSIFNK
jgi:hypothetical protein